MPDVSNTVNNSSAEDANQADDVGTSSSANANPATPDQSNDTNANLDNSVASAADDAANTSYDPYYPPIITLPEIVVNSGEEDEDELVRLRAKLFRYDSEADPPEWKERGTGDVKLLKHQETGQIRVLMRRDKTLKLCANHSVQPHMQLKSNCGSEKAFVWSVQADFSEAENPDDPGTPEVLAIRFANAENATKFKTAFDDAVKTVTSLKAKELKAKEENGGKEESELADKMEKVEIAAEK